MESDEEVDYMSDAFLHSICGKEDIKPGLLKCHAQQYDHKRAVKKIENDTKNRNRNPSLKEREDVSRESGLSKPIDNDNVGYKMLQKLGFKPGSGLGKSGEGRTEPIVVEVKPDRQGFGRKSSLEEIAKLRAKFRSEAKEKLLNIQDYRTRKAQEAAERSAVKDFKKSQKVCWELDIKECICEPAEPWFWPESKLPHYNEDEDEDAGENETIPISEGNTGVDEDESGPQEEDLVEEKEFSVQEKLEMLTLYLRRTYLYCLWCGCSFDDEKDLQQDCPGPTKDDHSLR